MHFTKLLIPHIGLDGFIDHIEAPELTDTSSDKTRLINKAVEALGLKKDECLMIGDTKYDILGAVGAKVDSIGVTYGFGGEEELREAGATYIARDPAEIDRIIE
ncbi:MAG: HAD hydrolase-like protein [Lachnospiraceae bacterium]|nr:HAD hydrolase-like protein [Lachnospiraceae bacterium]